ncbi:MAG: DUF2156 domain-containing protein [Thermodesulfobacteriota bacterium]
MLTFEAISLSRQKDYLNRLQDCPQKTSDYSFINLWAWAGEYGLEWAWEDELVWIRQRRPVNCYWAPVGKWDLPEWEPRLQRVFGQGATVARVPEMLLSRWKASAGGRFQVQESREQWDYLYDAESLRELSGNRYHAKMNLIRQFTKTHPYEFQFLQTDLLEKARAMQESWCTWRDCESAETLSAENRAIETVFASWEELQNLTGGALLVDGEMVAYTVGEQVSGDTLLIHFEKGKPGYKGVYQTIHQVFLQRHPDVSVVNREQDLGDEGLRKAKLSYHPVDFLKKYRVDWQSHSSAF